MVAIAPFRWTTGPAEGSAEIQALRTGKYFSLATYSSCARREGSVCQLWHVCHRFAIAELDKHYSHCTIPPYSFQYLFCWLHNVSGNSDNPVSRHECAILFFVRLDLLSLLSWDSFSICVILSCFWLLRLPLLVLWSNWWACPVDIINDTRNVTRCGIEPYSFWLTFCSHWSGLQLLCNVYIVFVLSIFSS